MALQHILDTIQYKSTEDAHHIIEEAQRESERIIQDAEEQAKKIKEHVADTLHKKAQTKINKTKRQAEIQMKNKILSAKREVMASLFDAASKKLADQKKHLIVFYEQLIHELPKVGDGEIITSQKDYELLKPLVEKVQKKCAMKIEPCESGFLYRSPSIDVDNRLSKLMGEIKEETEIEIANILFTKKP